MAAPDRLKGVQDVQETVPRAEVRGRVARLQGFLSARDIPLALIRQAADIFYYTGTVADGFLAVPAAGAPRFLVRRPKARLAAADLPWELDFYSDIKELPGLLGHLFPSPKASLGLELDVLSASLYLRLQSQLFPDAAIKDISPLIRQQRMVKSAYEVGQIRRAAAILDEAVAAVPEILRPGLTELALSAALEYRLRLLGHQGLIRVRNANLEIFFGHVLSGTAGLEAAYIDTPSGGLGFSPAFPQGPGLKPLAHGEPITVDIASCVNGYVADMTRLFVLGDLPPAAWRAYDLTLEIFAYFEAQARPGVLPGELYHEVWSLVEKAGCQEFFMGQGGEHVSFLGHGVGLELDEFPFLTARFPFPLEEDAVVAFEPKFFVPDVGLVGLEDTGRITSRGVEWLSRSPRPVARV